jgi:DNA modification methylase
MASQVRCKVGTGDVGAEPSVPDKTGHETFTLLHGDCLTALRKVPETSVQVIITSPPYADARMSVYGGIHPDRYVRWFLPRADKFMRVLHPSGTFILVIKEAVVDGERHPYVMELVLALRQQGWLLTEEWIWAKRNCTPGKWPNRFRDAWEHVYQFNLQREFIMNQDAVRVPVGEWAESRLSNLSDDDWHRSTPATGSPFGRNVANWVGRGTVYPSNVLHLATECSDQGHPATFPVALPEFFIKLFTRPGEVVLDPFSGSGTTGVAALRLGREYVGVDTNKEYLGTSRERLANAMGEVGPIRCRQ